MPRKKKTETVAEADVTKKEPGRKPAASKSTANKTAVKEPKETVMVQFAGKEYDVEAIKAAVKADYKGKVGGKVKLLDIYIKPEDGMAYYVVNEITGKVQL